LGPFAFGFQIHAVLIPCVAVCDRVVASKNAGKRTNQLPM
jgi:hypothetical protein